jgi:hypothetical protein
VAVADDELVLDDDVLDETMEIDVLDVETKSEFDVVDVVDEVADVGNCIVV